jgi:hypothetical protein
LLQEQCGGEPGDARSLDEHVRLEIARQDRVARRGAGAIQSETLSSGRGTLKEPFRL